MRPPRRFKVQSWNLVVSFSDPFAFGLYSVRTGFVLALSTEISLLIIYPTEPKNPTFWKKPSTLSLVHGLLSLNLQAIDSNTLPSRFSLQSLSRRSPIRPQNARRQPHAPPIRVTRRPRSQLRRDAFAIAVLSDLKLQLVLQRGARWHVFQ